LQPEIVGTELVVLVLVDVVVVVVVDVVVVVVVLVLVGAGVGVTPGGVSTAVGTTCCGIDGLDHASLMTDEYVLSKYSSLMSYAVPATSASDPGGCPAEC
jgi:hypothetical protein